MNRILLPLLLALSLAPVLCWAAEPKTEEAKAIAEIENLGGKVTRDGKTPGKPVLAGEPKAIAIDAGLEHLSEVTDTQTSNPKQPVISVSFTFGKVHETTLERLKKLPGLQSLSLTQVEIPRTGLATLKELPHLQALDLCCAKIGEAEVEHLDGLPRLKVLDISGTKITDAALQHLEGLTGLLWLNLAQTKVTDAGLAHLRGFSQRSCLFCETDFA